jgi:hypothetical protein
VRLGLLGAVLVVVGLVAAVVGVGVPLALELVAVGIVRHACNYKPVDWFGVPVVINVRDRLTDLVAQLDWLEGAGYRNILLLDNASTYPPLVEWLETEPPGRGIAVMRLRANVGSRAPWLVDCPERAGWFVYTDCDVVPTEGCPVDVVAHLHSLLRAHSEVPKAGVGLFIDDAPSFRDRHREQLFHNAAERWLGDCFDAAVETTFALYRPGVPFSFAAVRSGRPYEARHLPFYREANPTAEDLYYLAHARPSGLDANGNATGGSDWAAWAKPVAGSS